MKKLLLVGLVWAALGIAGVAWAVPVELVVNGGFESGDLSGWDIHCNVTVQNDTVFQGNYAAGLSISSEVTPSFFSFCTGDTDPFSAFLAQELEGFEFTNKIFTMSFAYNVDVLKNLSITGNDKLYAGYLALNRDWNNVQIYGQYELVANGDTDGWQSYEKTIDLSGYDFDDLYIGFFFADGCWLGSLDISSAFLDNISVKASPVPEPATMLLFGIGLCGLAFVGRKKLIRQ